MNQMPCTSHDQLNSNVSALREYPEWNSRYVLYSKTHGKTPQQMEDSESSMCGYICWITEQWRLCRDLNPDVEVMHGSYSNHAFFDAWLEYRVTRLGALQSRGVAGVVNQIISQ